MSGGEPLVSVVVPCHNAAAFLPGTLAAILAQEGPVFEVVLVDDGSTDGSADVARGLGDPRVRVETIPASGGPSRPRNTAIGRARGRYVFFCDADDVMRPGKLAAQCALLDRHPDVGLVYTDFEVIGPDGVLLEASFLAAYRWHRRLQEAGPGAGGSLDRALFVRGLLHENFIGTSGVAVRREVLEAVGGFDEGLASSEDLDLWLRIARHTGCAFCDIVGHGYRRHPGSLMQETSARHPAARITVLRRQLEFAADAGERRTILRRIARNEVSLGYVHELAGDAAAARHHYARSLRHDFAVGAAWGWLKCHTLGRLRQRRAGKEPAS